MQQDLSTVSRTPAGEPADDPFPVTRAAALARLDAFLPRAGADYARLRNFDRGAGQHQHVSRLSAALRRRVLSEAEVVRAVLDRHGLRAAEKFISEVFWRSYWKGWLEQRPAVWQGYLSALEQARRDLAASPDLARRYDTACAGRTGIDCFDEWSRELRDTGYLHNWARIQFASIWVFTLGLRWELGADLTLRQFIDADPASNTLSWRWVAGLHTAGKAYLADPSRINVMTGGRFAPKGLARVATIPVDSIAVPQAAGAPRAPIAPDPAQPTLLLPTAEDLSLETEPALAGLDVRAVAALGVDADGPDGRAIADGLARAGAHWRCPVLGGLAAPAVVAQARAAGCRQIVTAYAPVGPVADRIAALRPLAEAQGLPLAEHLRDWDRQTWPHCRKGFFALKDKIPVLLDAMGARE